MRWPNNVRVGVSLSVICWGVAKSRSTLIACGRVANPGRRGVFRHSIHRVSQELDDAIDVPVLRDVGRRDQHVISAAAVDGAAHRVARKPPAQRFGLDARMHLESVWKRRLGATVCDDLNRLKEPTAANVANMRVSGETFAQTRGQSRTQSPYCLQKTLVGDYALYG